MNLNEVTYRSQPGQIYISTVLLGIVFFGLTFFLRFTSNDFSIPFIILFLGISMLCLATRRMETFILLLLIVTSTVFTLIEFPTVPIRIGDLFLSDVLIIIMLLGRLLKRVTINCVVIPKPMGYPILAYIFVAIFTFLYTITSTSVSISTAGMDLRVFFYLSLFFLVYYYIKSDKQLRSFLMAIGILAVILSIIQIVQWIIGYDNDILGGRIMELTTAGKNFRNVGRVVLPGTSIIFFTLNVIFSIYIFKRLHFKWRLLLLIGIVLLSIGIILTFLRALWVAIFIAAAIVTFKARRRMTVYPRIIMLLIGACLLVSLIGQTKILRSFAIKEAVSDRAMSIINPQKTLQHDTMLVRLIEIRYAWKKIVENPLIGIGFKTSYRPLIFGNVKYEKSNAGTFVHNGYLSIQLKMGLLGSLAFLWMIITFFYRVTKFWRKIKDSFYQAVVLGVSVSIVGILVFSLTSPDPLIYIYWVAVTAVGFGIVEKIYQLEGIA